MHLGYHELRKMLKTFKEERDARRMAPPQSVPSGGPPPGQSRDPRSSDYRSSKDDYRERDRGYDRDRSSRHE